MRMHGRHANLQMEIVKIVPVSLRCGYKNLVTTPHARRGELLKPRLERSVRAQEYLTLHCGLGLTLLRTRKSASVQIALSCGFAHNRYRFDWYSVAKPTVKPYQPFQPCRCNTAGTDTSLHPICFYSVLLLRLLRLANIHLLYRLLSVQVVW